MCRSGGVRRSWRMRRHWRICRHWRVRGSGRIGGYRGRCSGRGCSHNYSNYRRSAGDHNNFFLFDIDRDKDGIAKGVSKLICHAPEAGVCAYYIRGSEPDGDLIIPIYINGSTDPGIRTTHTIPPDKHKGIVSSPVASAGISEPPGLGKCLSASEDSSIRDAHIFDEGRIIAAGS